MPVRGHYSGAVAEDRSLEAAAGAEPQNDVLSAEQLRRITSLHRGFTYQHLYAVGCLLRLQAAEVRRLRVERDEDVEVEFDNRWLYLQVKTRRGNLTWGDVEGAVDQFRSIRDEHTAGRRSGTPYLVVVTNAGLGPDLLTRTRKASWPVDVAIVGPGRPHPAETWLPAPGSDLAAMLQNCTDQAEHIPFGSLSAETLVWKLAARVQYACTGAHGHEFAAADLPQLYEQFVEELQAFPQLPAIYRHRSGEPELANDNSVRLVVGFSGAGKTTWAANAAAHCPQQVTYFDVAGYQAASVPGALARELAARHFRPEAGSLPAAAGIEVLRAVHTLLVQAEIEVAVVVDNVHLLEIEDVRLLVDALPTARLIMLGHPRPEQIPLAAHLGISTESLDGWGTDTIAAVFDSEGCILDYGTAQRVLSLTAGLPLYVLNSAQLTRTAYAGDGAAFCDSVQAETHSKATAQEMILRQVLDRLAPRSRAVAGILAVAEVPLTGTELQRLAEAVSMRPTHAAQAVRDLSGWGFTQDFADGRVTLHDAVRPVALSASEDLPDEAAQRLREALLDLLEGQRGFPQVGRWMRLLAETGRIEQLLDLTTMEAFYEGGYPREIHATIAQTAQDPAQDNSIRFEAHNALATLAYSEGDQEAYASHVNVMEQLAAEGGDSSIGPRERVLLAIRQFILYGRAQDAHRLTAAFTAGLAQVVNGSREEHALRYNFANGLYQAGEFDRADVVATRLAADYCAYLGLSPSELTGPIIGLEARVGSSEDPDDYKRLADCLSLSVRARRSQGVVSGPETLSAIPAMHLYQLTGCWRQAVDSGQEVVDILMNAGDMQQALSILNRLLAMAKEFNLQEMMVGLRSQRAVVLAWLGDIAAARAEIGSLSGYEATPDQAADIRRQKSIIESLAAQQPS
ncbi:hypothetical protein GCM10017668_23630 [Streptomyces tuirus]|uniref:Uncharacterized protein n=1 Tax=Streptomyces tuirus TaxID=68278 RepID=A0A7G1NFL8_9ACTN|nr:hypothetical protein GCM10017668_23630 [Streptomyces tuirus]